MNVDSLYYCEKCGAIGSLTDMCKHIILSDRDFYIDDPIRKYLTELEAGSELNDNFHTVKEPCDYEP